MTYMQQLLFLTEELRNPHFTYELLCNLIGEVAHASCLPLETVEAAFAKVWAPTVKGQPLGERSSPYEFARMLIALANQGFMQIGEVKRLKVDVKHCARCGRDHPQLEFKALSNPADNFTHWATCPVLEEPIRLQIQPESSRSSGAQTFLDKE